MEAPKEWNVTFTKHLKQKLKRKVYRNCFLSLYNSIGKDNPDEVCPVRWKPREKSMKPGPELSKEYFAVM